MDQHTRRSNVEIKALLDALAGAKDTQTKRHTRKALLDALRADGYTPGAARTLADRLVSEARRVLAVDPTPGKPLHPPVEMDPQTGAYRVAKPGPNVSSNLDARPAEKSLDSFQRMLIENEENSVWKD